MPDAISSTLDLEAPRQLALLEAEQDEARDRLHRAVQALGLATFRTTHRTAAERQDLLLVHCRPVTVEQDAAGVASIMDGQGWAPTIGRLRYCVHAVLAKHRRTGAELTLVLRAPGLPS